jgi:hypothetical protein
MNPEFLFAGALFFLWPIAAILWLAELAAFGIGPFLV